MPSVADLVKCTVKWQNSPVYRCLDFEMKTSLEFWLDTLGKPTEFGPFPLRNLPQLKVLLDPVRNYGFHIPELL